MSQAPQRDEILLLVLVASDYSLSAILHRTEFTESVTFLSPVGGDGALVGGVTYARYGHHARVHGSVLKKHVCVAVSDGGGHCSDGECCHIG